MLALNILRNGFFLQVDTRFVHLHWCKWCTYFLRFHSVFLQWAVNKSVCLNDEGKLTVWKWKQMLKHATTWHLIPHQQTWAYSAAHAIHESYSQEGGGGGKLAYLTVRVGRKDFTHKKAIYPKNHRIISVPQITSLVYYIFMWIKLTVWVIVELNKSECAIDKIRVVQQCQPPKWISCPLRVIEKGREKTITNQNFRPLLPTPPTQDTYNPLTLKDLLSAKTSSSAERAERGERAWLGTAKKN